MQVLTLQPVFQHFVVHQVQKEGANAALSEDEVWVATGDGTFVRGNGFGSSGG